MSWPPKENDILPNKVSQYITNNNNNTIFIQVTSVQLMKAAINMGPVDVERPSLKIKNLQ